MKAIILAAGVGKRLHPVTESLPKCLIRIGGKTLIRRMLEALGTVGVHEAVIVVGHEKEKIQAEVKKTIGPVAVRYIVNPDYQKGSILSLYQARGECGDDLLIMDADVLFSTALLHCLARSRHESAFLIDERAEGHGEEMMLVSRDGRVVEISRKVAGRSDPPHVVIGEGVGFLKLSRSSMTALARILDRLIAEGKEGKNGNELDYEEALNLLVKETPVGYEPVGNLPWTEVDFEEDVVRAEREILPRLREAEKALYASLGTPIDGIVDTYLNRKISRYLTKIFVTTRFTPNAITVMSMLIGLSSAAFYLSGRYGSALIGALLFQLSAVVDCCDGEVARLKGLQSRTGRWVDVICDNIVHVALFAAIAWSLYRRAGNTSFAIAGALAAGGTIPAFLLAFPFLSGDEPKKGVTAMLGRMANRDFSVVLLLFTVVGRLDWFLYISAAGITLYWVTALIVSLRR